MKKFLKYIFLFVILYLCLFGFYLSVNAGIRNATFGLQSRRYIPCALAIVLALSLWWQSGYSKKVLLSHGFVALSWIITYPLFFWLTNGGSITEIDNHMDISFGSYCFAATVFLHYLLLGWLRVKSTVGAFLISVLQIVLLVLPFGQWVYFSYYESYVSNNAILAALQTNPSEAKEYYLENIGYGGTAIIVVLLLLLFVILWRINSQNSGQESKKLSLKPGFAILLACLWCFSYLWKILPEVGVGENYLDAKAYLEESPKFAMEHEANLARLSVSAKLFPKPSTVILVIGESASRDYLSAYRPNLERDMSPWLRSMQINPGSILFSHAYACWGQTVQVLERALTTKNQYNEIEFYKAVSIVDMARKAGFTTHWFSNQGSIAGTDAPATMIARTCNHYFSVEELVQDKKLPNDYDMSLVPLLKTVNPADNNFIILHLHGSHESYNARYPADFTKWGTPGKAHQVDNHANSILYTDTVLKEIFTFAEKNLHLQSFVYFSDHGGVPDHKRHPDKSNFKHLRIPLYVYLSPDYRALFPQTATNLKQNKEKYVSNDLMFELLCGLLQLSSPEYNEENSLTSEKYKWTKDTLTTDLGKRKLSEDPGAELD